MEELNKAEALLIAIQVSLPMDDKDNIIAKPSRIREFVQVYTEKQLHELSNRTAVAAGSMIAELKSEALLKAVKDGK